MPNFLHILRMQCILRMCRKLVILLSEVKVPWVRWNCLNSENAKNIDEMYCAVAERFLCKRNLLIKTDLSQFSFLTFKNKTWEYICGNRSIFSRQICHIWTLREDDCLAIQWRVDYLMWSQVRKVRPRSIAPLCIQNWMGYHSNISMLSQLVRGDTS